VSFSCAIADTNAAGQETENALRGTWMIGGQVYKDVTAVWQILWNLSKFDTAQGA
jgi:hypothetical protein